MESDYPQAFEYFAETRHLLDRRDRGSAKGPTWYRYIRTQNIALQSLKKLAVPRLVSRLKAGYDDDGSFCLDNVDVGGIILSDESHLSYEAVLALLNSKLVNFFFQLNSVPFRGGFFSANRQYIEKIPMPNINTKDPQQRGRCAELSELGRGMVRVRQQLESARTANETTRLQRQVDAADRQIDLLVYELYGLTDKEIRIVEEATKR